MSQTLRVLSISARARAPLCEEELAPFLFFLEREVREKETSPRKKMRFRGKAIEKCMSLCISKSEDAEKLLRHHTPFSRSFFRMRA